MLTLWRRLRAHDHEGIEPPEADAAAARDRRRGRPVCARCLRWSEDEALVFMSNGLDYCASCASAVQGFLFTIRPAGRRATDVRTEQPALEATDARRANRRAIDVPELPEGVSRSA